MVDRFRIAYDSVALDNTTWAFTLPPRTLHQQLDRFSLFIPDTSKSPLDRALPNIQILNKALGWTNTAAVWPEVYNEGVTTADSPNISDFSLTLFTTPPLQDEIESQCHKRWEQSIHSKKEHPHPDLVAENSRQADESEAYVS